AIEPRHIDHTGTSGAAHPPAKGGRDSGGGVAAAGGRAAGGGGAAGRARARRGRPGGRLRPRVRLVLVDLDHLTGLPAAVDVEDLVAVLDELEGHPVTHTAGDVHVQAVALAVEDVRVARVPVDRGPGLVVRRAILGSRLGGCVRSLLAWAGRVLRRLDRLRRAARAVDVERL